jgi:hypothetical protein
MMGGGGSGEDYEDYEDEDEEEDEGEDEEEAETPGPSSHVKEHNGRLYNYDEEEADGEAGEETAEADDVPDADGVRNIEELLADDPVSSDDEDGGAVSGGGTTTTGGGVGAVTQSDVDSLLNELEGESPGPGGGDGSYTDQPGLDGPPVDTSALGINPPDLSGTDDLGEMANALYRDERSIAPRLRDGSGEPRLAGPATNPDGTVGWDTEIPGEESRESLEARADNRGRTAQFMHSVDLPPEAASEHGSGEAFITRYKEADGNWTDVGEPPHIQYGVREMTTAAFCDAVGANVPLHVYDPETNEVMSEGFEGEAVADADDWVLQQVGRDHLLDTMAVQVLAGNRDPHGENVFVNERGELACIDLDYSGFEIRDPDHTADFVKGGPLQEVRDAGGPDVTRQDVATRAQEIAVALHNEGKVSGALAAAGSIEAASHGDGEITGAIEGNIEMLVKGAQDTAERVVED